MVGSGKTYFVCNLLHGPSPIGKKLDSPHDSQIVYIIAETNARLIEQTAQVAHRESEMGSQLRHLQILMQMLLQIGQNRMQTCIIGNGQHLQQETHILADGRQQFEKAECKGIQIGRISLFYLRPLGSNKFQVLCNEGVGVINGEFLQGRILVIRIQRQIENNQ